MSEAKEAKQREWRCNIFGPPSEPKRAVQEASQGRNEQSVGRCLNTSVDSSRQGRKDSSGPFLHHQRSLTPGWGPKEQRNKEGISMQKILQPYLALNLICHSNDGGFTAKSPNQSVFKQDTSVTRAKAKPDTMQTILSTERVVPSRSAIKVRPELQMGIIQEERMYQKSPMHSAMTARGADSKQKSFQPILREKNRGMVNAEQKDSSSISQSFVSRSNLTLVQMFALSQSKREQRPEIEKRRQDKLSSSNLDISQDSILAGLGSNHQIGLERQKNKQTTPTAQTQRSKFSSTHDWKFEVKPEQKAGNCDKFDPRAMRIQQFRSGLDSEDLLRIYKESDKSEKLSKSFTGAFSSSKMPTYLETVAPSLDNLDESRVQVLNIEMSKLPQNTNDKELKRAFFKNQHVISMATEKDNFTGDCKGQGNIQIRCKDNDQTIELLDSLKSKGLNFVVKSMSNIKDTSVSTQFGINTRSADIDKKNSWLEESKKQNEKTKLAYSLNRSSNNVSCSESVGKYMTNIKQTKSPCNLNSTVNTNTTAQNKSIEYLSAKNMVNQNSQVYNTISEEGFKSVNYPASHQTNPHHSKGRNCVNKENLSLSKAKSSKELDISGNYKTQQDCVNRLFSEKQNTHVIKMLQNVANQAKMIQQKSCANIHPLNPNSSLLKPTLSSKSKRSFI